MENSISSFLYFIKERNFSNSSNTSGKKYDWKGVMNFGYTVAYIIITVTIKIVIILIATL
jgi:hypothetical protein